MSYIDEVLYGFPVHNEARSYGKGWNNCLRAVRARMENMEGQWVPKGYVHLPTTRAEAEMMNLISENWLKNNVTSQGKEDGNATRNDPYMG
jgi:hypothetical protein